MYERTTWHFPLIIRFYFGWLIMFAALTLLERLHSNFKPVIGQINYSKSEKSLNQAIDFEFYCGVP